jgi:hypothetical protein
MLKKQEWQREEMRSVKRRLPPEVLMCGVLLLAFPLHLHAACSRADVEFYLEKGFTQEQITAICTSGGDGPSVKMKTSPPAEPSSANLAKPGKETNLPRQSSQASRSGSDEKAIDLAIAIKGYDVQIDTETLGYTTEECIEYGAEDLFGFKNKECLKIRYTINLDGLEVIGPARKMFFFGTGGIRVRGDIDCTIVSGLNSFSTEDRRRLAKQLEDGNETDIPIREGIPIEDVEATLKRLAR